MLNTTKLNDEITHAKANSMNDLMLNGPIMNYDAAYSSDMPVKVANKFCTEKSEKDDQNLEAVSADQSIHSAISFSVTPPHLKTYNRVEYSINQTNMTEAAANTTSTSNANESNIPNMEIVSHSVSFNVNEEVSRFVDESSNWSVNNKTAIEENGSRDPTLVYNETLDNHNLTVSRFQDECTHLDVSNETISIQFNDHSTRWDPNGITHKADQTLENHNLTVSRYEDESANWTMYKEEDHHRY